MNLESQPEAELELSLAQLPNQPSEPAVSMPVVVRRPDGAGPSRPPKQPRLEQRFHGDLQKDARALVILLQVGCVEPGTREVMFEGSFEGLNKDQYFCCMSHPLRGSPGHHRFLRGPVNSLARSDRADYIAVTIKRILKFLEME
jgi:hypothetical protein